MTKQETARKDGQHTPGPWAAWDNDGTGTLPCVLSKGVTAAGNFYVSQCNVYEDARRIVACVNACEGINPEAVPDLLAACRETLSLLMNYETGKTKSTFNDGRVLASIGPLAGAIRKAEGRE